MADIFGGTLVADNGSIRVLIGEASNMASQLIADILRKNRSPRFELILPSSLTSAGVIDQIVKLNPDVAVISNSLQDGAAAGYEVLQTLQLLKHPVRPILLLEECARAPVIEAFRVGARGIFARTESTGALCKCICTVYRGQVWVGTSELNYLLEELASSCRSRRILDVKGRPLLSAREEEIVALVADGLTNRQISKHLKLSEHTVKNYLFNVFDKLGVSSRVELVLYAISRASANGSEVVATTSAVSADKKEAQPLPLAPEAAATPG